MLDLKRKVYSYVGTKRRNELGKRGKCKSKNVDVYGNPAHFFHNTTFTVEPWMIQ